MAEAVLSEDQRKVYRLRLFQKESEYTRLRRIRFSSSAFESIKLIGKGAFGEVSGKSVLLLLHFLLLTDYPTGAPCSHDRHQ